MGEFTVTMPDGSKFKAEGDTAEAAHANVQEFLKQERVDASKKEYDDAPITSKARMLIGDPLQQFTHGLTAGMFDKGFDAVTGANSAAETQAAGDRIGPVATGAARMGGAVMLPSGVPKAVTAVGGGPVVRGLIGGGTAAAEGGVYGGVNAYSEGESVPKGILGGAVGGAVGQQVGQAVGNTANRVVKYAKGINDAAPARNMTTFGNIQSPTAKDMVDVAAARATHTGSMKGTAEATQAAQRSEFGKLLTGPDKKMFTPVQRDRMGKIVYGDAGTKLAETTGDMLGDKLLASGLGAGVGFGTGVIPGILATGATLAAGKGLRKDSATATKEAVDSLRQLMYKKKPFKGPMSPAKIRTLGQGAGYLGREATEDYLD